MSSSSPPPTSGDPFTSVSPSASTSAYPFPDFHYRPSSVSGTTRSRRGSNSSTTSVTSIGGKLDSQSRRRDPVSETSQNAISTLLQPPIVRTGLVPHTHASAAATGFKQPTTKDIPPVTLTNLPHVPPDTFRDYLDRIGPLFETLRRGRQNPDQTPWMKKDKDVEDADHFPEVLDGRRSRDGSISPALTRHTSTISPVDSPGRPRRRSSAQSRRNRNEPTPLSTIPTVYFDEGFHLENPRTFDVVSERAEIVRPPPGAPGPEQKAPNGAPLPPRKALATNAILQEKLSWYMDTVEVHLINSISAASTGFFTALGSLKELQTEAEESVAKIQGLRADLRKLDQEVALGGLEVAAKRRRRANIEKLSRATAQVQLVVENVKRADSLVDKGLYDKAAEQMDQVGRLVCGQADSDVSEDDLIDLRPLKALQSLDTGLQELQFRIGTGFAQRFTATLLSDLRQHIGRVPRSDTLKRWSKQRGIPPTYMEIDDRLRNDLLSALDGLYKAGHTAPATTAYREAVTKEMKTLIRKYLPSSSDDDADSMVSTSTRGGNKLNQQEKSSILARNLRAMEAEDAEMLLINIYTSVSEALRRVATQTKVLLDVTSSMQTPEPRSPPKSPNGTPKPLNLASLDEQLTNGASLPQANGDVKDELSRALDMSSLLGQAVDTAQTQITRVLKVRSEQSIRLPKDRFLRYFTLNRLFADECEAVSGRGGQALKGIINAQISGFVQALGTAETERAAEVLDADDWNAVDFKDSDEVLLQRILGSMSADPPEWTQTSQPIWEELKNLDLQADGEATTNGIAPPTSNGTPAGKTATAKPATVDETRYILVASASSLLRTIDLFLSLTSKLPSLTPTISTALLEILRTFNSRSCQLILGAGATRSAGLKNITTKHLALASQALSFVVALIPYMRECVRRHLSAGQTTGLAEWDKTKRLFQEHQSGIHDKLVEIMTGRSLAHVKAMHAQSFTLADAPSPDNKPSAYMETLTKETLTLHRVLNRHLSEVDVNLIMRQIFASYREQWIKAFTDVDVQGKHGEVRLLRDAECFDSRLSKVPGFVEIGKEILAVVRARVSDEAAE